MGLLDPVLSQEERESQATFLIYFLVITTVAQTIAYYFMFYMLNTATQYLIIDLRKRLMDSLLKQEVEFFERQSVESLPSKITEQFTVLEDGVG